MHNAKCFADQRSSTAGVFTFLNGGQATQACSVSPLPQTGNAASRGRPGHSGYGDRYAEANIPDACRAGLMIQPHANGLTGKHLVQCLPGRLDGARTLLGQTPNAVPNAR